MVATIKCDTLQNVSSTVTNLTLGTAGQVTVGGNLNIGGNYNITGSLTLGSALSVGNGGTGLTSLTAGYIPYASSSSALSFSSGLQSDGTNLTVAGNVTLGNTITAKSSTGGIFNFNSTTTGTTNTLGSYANNGAAFADLQISANKCSWYSAGSPAMTLDASGNLLVGATSAVGKLTINSLNGSTSYNNCHIFLQNSNQQNNDRALIITNFTTSVATGSNGYTPVAFGGIQTDYTNRYGAFVVYVSSSDNVTPSSTTERLRIDNNGNVGIGTTSPGYKLDVNAATSRLAVNTTSYAFTLVNNTGGNFYTGLEASSGGNLAVGSSGYAAVLSHTGAYSLQFGTNNTIRATIDSSGNLLVGTTVPNAKIYGMSGANSPVGRFDATLTSGYTSEVFQVIAGQPSGTGYKIAAFYLNNAAAYAAYIRGDGAIFAQNTTLQPITSDINLKTDIIDYDKGLNEVCAMRPRYFKYKSDLNITRTGFIAQEMDEALPGSMVNSAVDGVKTYEIDWNPLLVKAIQELNAKFEAYVASHP